jgi:5-oxoprolinase (ATP-hydrolysing) subunit A
MTRPVDLNCDMGETTGAASCGGSAGGNDEELIKYISSANIACGFHAGSPTVMRRTVRLAARHGVAIGAHPSLRDSKSFGRQWMDTPPEEAFDIVLYQIGALAAIARSEGASLRHVKPHGALYNRAARDAELARAIAEAVKQVDPQLVLFGLSGSELVRAGEAAGLATASEVFADRTYQADGSLTPRVQPDAQITDPQHAARRALEMIREGRVMSQQGTPVAVKADTICIHGDGKHAIEFACAIRQALDEAGIEVRPFAPPGGPP